MIPGYYWILLTANPVRNADTAADSMTRQRVFILWSGMARNGQESARNLFSKISKQNIPE